MIVPTYQQVAGGTSPGRKLTASKICDLCGAENPEEYFDMYIGGTQWANVCKDCVAHEGINIRLGVGLGQHYQKV